MELETRPTESHEGPVPRRRAQRPGSLYGEVSLTLNTWQAVRLVRGRRRSPEKPPIIGLTGFARHLALIWQAAGDDDPYADWWLIRIENAIEGCLSDLSNRNRLLMTRLDLEPYLHVGVATSVSPQAISLQFATPHAFRAAHCLGEFDQLWCLWLTLRHVGLAMPEQFRDELFGAGKRLRGLLALPSTYYHAQIDRDDVRQNNQRAQKAIAQMGPVPDEVVSGACCPRFRPGPSPERVFASELPKTPALLPAIVPSERSNHAVAESD